MLAHGNKFAGGGFATTTCQDPCHKKGAFTHKGSLQGSKGNIPGPCLQKVTKASNSAAS